MRVSALRLTHEHPPPPPIVWEGFEDVLHETVRHGRLWVDPETGPGWRLSSAPYNRRADERWLEQQNAKNKARALAEYEWRKPENAAARIAAARAAWQAQRAAQEEADSILREQLAEAEALRQYAKKAAKALRDASDEERRAAYKAAYEKRRAAEAERREADAAAAIAWWSEINPAYRYEVFRSCQFAQPMRFGSVTLEAGKGYLLPLSVRGTLLKELGYG